MMSWEITRNFDYTEKWFPGYNSNLTIKFGQSMIFISQVKHNKQNVFGILEKY